MLDSSPNVTESTNSVLLLETSNVPVTRVGENLAIAVADLLALQEQDEIFTGFDEVWLFESVPPSPKPSGIRLTSDKVLTAPPPGLSEWMSDTDCKAGLGDGDGLNFTTFDPILAGIWRS
jgi:hypothetical protein